MRSSQSPSRVRSAAVSAVRSGSAARKVTAAAAGPVVAAVLASVRMVAHTDSHAVSASVSSRSARGLVDEGEHDSRAGRVDEVDRPSFGHAQPSRLGDPAYPGLQDPDAGRGDGPALRGAQRRVHEPEQLGVRQPEADVQLPPGVQALDRIGIRGDGGLARQVAREPVLGDGVEQAVLVAEEPVDRGCLHAGGERDRAGGHRVRTLGGEQARGDLHQLRAGPVSRRRVDSAHSR